MNSTVTRSKKSGCTLVGRKDERRWQTKFTFIVLQEAWLAGGLC
jgi:hypothetical protein